jgi:Leucine-rich repeat (LRR) protein
MARIFIILIAFYFHSCVVFKRTTNVKIIDLSDQNLSAIPDSVFKHNETAKLFLGPRTAIINPLGGYEAYSPNKNNLLFLPEVICTLKNLEQLDVHLNNLDSLLVASLIW